jgi:hypothetical protein
LTQPSGVWDDVPVHERDDPFGDFGPSTFKG